jgi:signal transduction histidine kinase/CheY-like chemotaxis protein
MPVLCAPVDWLALGHFAWTPLLARFGWSLTLLIAAQLMGLPKLKAWSYHATCVIEALLCTLMLGIIIHVDGGPSNPAFLWYMVLPLCYVAISQDYWPSTAMSGFLCLCGCIIELRWNGVGGPLLAEWLFLLVPACAVAVLSALRFHTVRQAERQAEQERLARERDLARESEARQQAETLVASRTNELQTAQARLVQAERLAVAGQLAAGVAHEINNPLAFIMGNLDFLREELTGSLNNAHEVWQCFDEIRQGAERIRTIVRDLKTFSRPDDQPNKAIDLEPVIEFSLTMAANELRHRAEVVKELGPMPRVEAHEGRLSQVFLNLLINAAQAIPEGQASQHRVRIVGKAVDGWACVEISDTGVGMGPEVLARIFDPFFTTKPIGVGTGLGLSICHGIITSLGGKLEVDSQVGHGTTMRVMLPGRPKSVDAAGLASSASASMASETPQQQSRPMRVVLVEDDPLVMTAVERLLGQHTVSRANSGREGLRLLLESPSPDVVLCDLMMPDMTGAALFEEICRVRPELADRFVFMTGGAFTTESRCFLEQARRPVLEKPFSSEQLQTTLEKAAALSATPT